MKSKTKKIIFIIISIVLATAAIAASTYALFYFETVAPTPSEFSTGTLSVTAASKSSVITLNNTLPMTDAEGSATEPYIFTIKNTGTVDCEFYVKLSGGSNSFSPKYIKLKIDNDNVTTLEKLAYIIKKDVHLKAGESMDISIRIWLDANTPNTEIGKGFSSKIEVFSNSVPTKNN